jgi:adenosylcobalamin-dependent ribonucleoside-triphosphate reductase
LRVTEGTYSFQKQHCQEVGLPWDEEKAQKSAEEFFDRMFHFKFTPPGRGLEKMGTPYIWKKQNGASLNNCGFVTTENIDQDFANPFCFLMDFSMLGVGVGSDVLGAGSVVIQEPNYEGQPKAGVLVSDSREGWVGLIRCVLNSYVGKASWWNGKIAYSAIRKKGEPIGFGGTASGPEPLKQLVEDIHEILTPLIGKPITETAIADIHNAIGVCVVSGGIRRTAEILFGAESTEFLGLKDPTANGARLERWGWTSNNSIFADVGQKYNRLAGSIAANGEPGALWLRNVRAYGRLMDGATDADIRAIGANPCVEQSLEDQELCTLVETYPANCTDLYDWLRTLKFAYLYAKTVTLIPTHDKRVNAVMMRNRRIGTSLSGIIQAVHKYGWGNFRKEIQNGYEAIRQWDDTYSNWLCVPKSIKVTSVKPSGTVSLLSGATPGIHHPHAEYYWRVIRFASDSDYLPQLRASGYRCYDIGNNQVAVYFPVRERLFVRGESDVTMWEQLELAAQLQYYWSDNQVSCTVKFKEHEAQEISRALSMYETRLKGISFLPESHGYEHAPMQAMEGAEERIPIGKSGSMRKWLSPEDEYFRAVASLKPLNLDNMKKDSSPQGCDGASCEV